MKRCWLHIGMHKTGSSSVQHNLAVIQNPEGWRLLSVGGRPNMGPALFAMFNGEPHTYSWFTRNGDTPGEVAANGALWLDQLRTAITEFEEGSIIISAEALPDFSVEDILALNEFLGPLFDEIYVIGYVRPPVAYKISRFQEYTKHRPTAFDFTKIRLNYRHKFKKFDAIFGRSNVVLRKFDPASFNGQCLVADFCQQIGIEFPKNTPIRRVNESMSREACGMLYAYRKFGPSIGAGKNVIRENLRLMKPFLAMRGSKFSVSRLILNEAIEHERKDIAWMEKRLGVSLDEVINEDDSAITSEDDLLTISRKACEEYAARFKEFYDVDLPLEAIPQQDPIDPRLVANLVENSRVLSSQIRRDKRKQAAEIAKSANKKWIRKTWFWRFKRFTMRRLTRLFGTDSSR
jgi:hypothetical protein